VSESFFLFPRWLVIAIAALIVLIGIVKKILNGSKKKHQHEIELEEELARLRAAK
jgi:high-affinity nickel permease